jgi:hypothetical protein
MSIRNTGHTHGPFVAVITDPKNPEDPDYPMVVMPENGFQSVDEILAWWGRMKEGEGLDLTITNIKSLSSFKAFMSW